MKSIDKNTVDRTDPFTALGINNSSLQNKNSVSQRTTSNFSLNQQITISAQNLIPVLNSIKQQNLHMETQTQKMHEQMNYLDSLTQKIVIENQQLRLHYKERTTDLQSLIKTLTLNYNQNISQIKHMVHNYRQHNSLIAKQIQRIRQETQNKSQIIQKIKQYLNDINHNNIKLQQKVRNYKVKNKITDNNIKTLEKKKNQTNIQQIQRQICDLIVDVNMLQKKNKITLKYLIEHRNQLHHQKPKITHNALATIKSVNLLKQQLIIIENDCNKFNNQKQYLTNRAQNCYNTYLSTNQQLQNKQQQLIKLSDNKKQLQQKNNQILSILQKLKKQLKLKQTQKTNVQKQKQKKLKQIQNLSTNHQKQKQIISKNMQQKISNIKIQMNKNQIQFNNMESVYQNQKEKYGEQVNSFKNQLLELEKEENQLYQKVQLAPNLIKEIMKMQMALKRIKPTKC